MKKREIGNIKEILKVFENPVARGVHTRSGLKGAHTGKPEEIHSGGHDEAGIDKKIKLVMVDMDSNESRPFDINEARQWDWGNPTRIRLIGDWQVANWDQLVEIVRYKVDRGYQEVRVYEAPRFMLFSGG